ncbi:hypothetical protein IW261DRAFT_1315537, partial [Armillaria novae-zelandiae]
RPRRDSFSHHPASREISPHQSIPAVVPSKTPNMPSRSISPSPDLQRPSRSRNDTSGSLTSNAGAARSVRWNQNLICPSPIWPEQRRKGWFNQRGDQLWTNTGTYKTPEPGDEFPLDLDGYPEPGQGWMNEDGVRIDMMHRLVPKPPLRSALK